MNFYEDLAKFQINRSKPRSYYIPYDTEEKAKRSSRSEKGKRNNSKNL